MRITEKDQVTIPTHLQEAAGMLRCSDVIFTQEGGKIIITRQSREVSDERRERFKRAADNVARTMSPEFRDLSAEEIIAFLRPVDDDAA